MRWRHWTMAVVVASAFAGSASAQTLDPTSSRNIAPAVAPASLAAVEARRKELFAQMLRDPANLDVAFDYAALSVQAGDIESAISTLERMLIFAPGLPRLQFELGVLYYRLRAYETAGTYFRTVAANPGVPPEVAAQANAYLEAIAKGGQDNAVSAMLTTGIRWQSNANAGPDDPTVMINGVPFVLNAGAMGAPDVNAYASASLNAAIDLRRQGATFDLALAGYGALYRTQTTLNTGVIQIKAGPTFSLQAFDMDNATLSLYGVASAAILGGSFYQGSVGVGSQLRVGLSAQSRVILTLEGREEIYTNSALRPTATNGNGERFTATMTVEHQLTPAVMAFLTLTGERGNARVGYMSHWKGGASTGVVVRFDSPIAALDGKWSWVLSGGVRHQANDQPDPVFSPTDPKGTTQGFVETRLTVPLSKGFALQGAASYTVSASNYALDTYSNATASMGLSKGF